MNVAVLGADEGGCALAADLAVAGHSVRLWASREEELAPIREAGGTIMVGERGQSRAKLDRVSAELGDGVVGAEVVIVPLPATAHQELAGRLAPVLAEQQIVLLTPGTFGSYVMAREIARAGGRLPFAFVETGAPACWARRTGPAGVATPVRPPSLPTGVFPAVRAIDALGRLRALFPAMRPCRDALDAALTNTGPVVHPPLVLANAAAIDAGPVALDVSSAPPSVRRLIETVDGERVAIRESLGFLPLHDEVQSRLAGGGSPEESVTFEHRYVTEDAALGLSLLESAGRLAVVDTPAISGLLSVFAALLGRDLRAAGRGLDRLGLGDFVRREIDELLRDGWLSTLWRRL